MTSLFRNHYNYLFRFFCFYSVFNEHLCISQQLQKQDLQAKHNRMLRACAYVSRGLYYSPCVSSLR